MGGEWAEGYKASDEQNKLAGTIGGITNAIGTVVSVIIFFIHVFISHALNLHVCGAIDTPNVPRYCKVCLSHRTHANLKHVK